MHIVSHDFDMKGVTPDKVVSIESKEDGVRHDIYLWTTPLKKEPENDTSCVRVSRRIGLSCSPPRSFPPRAGFSPPGAKLEKLVGGSAFTEGPVADAQGNVYFTDQPNDRILKWSIEGKLSTFMQPCGRSNGRSAASKETSGRAADAKNEMWRIDPAGKATVVIKDYQGQTAQRS